MCFLLKLIILQVLMLEYVTSYPYKDYIMAYIPIEELAYLTSENVEVIPLPYYGNHYYDSWQFRSSMMQNNRFPYWQTTGPATFRGQVKAKGAVSMTGEFGNQGCGTFTSYSAPPTPLTVTFQPALTTTSTAITLPSTIPPPCSTLPTPTTLPTITTLPAVTVPSITLPGVNMPSTILPSVTMPSITVPQTLIDTLPTTVSVPTTPMPFITVTTTVPTDGNVANPVKFSGMVPASGRVKISAHFC